VIIVEMRKTHDVVIVALGSAEIGFELTRQIDTPVRRIVLATHVSIIHKHFLAVGKIKSRAIGIAERMEGQFCSHRVYLALSWG
jgi:hypothetical protein